MKVGKHEPEDAPLIPWLGLLDYASNVCLVVGLAWVLLVTLLAVLG